MFQYPSSFMTVQGLILLTLSRISSAPGDEVRGPSAILTRYELFAKMKGPLRGTRYSTREEIIGAVGRSLLGFDRTGRADGVQHLTQIWQKVVHMGGRLFCKNIRGVATTYYPTLVFR
jgi:hypothetical protein